VENPKPFLDAVMQRGTETLEKPMLAKLVYASWHNFIEPRGFREKKALAQEMQRWPQEQVGDWQWAKVRELLEHAQRAVPYYQHLFADLGIQAGDIRSWDDFSHLPILTKEDIQGNLGRLLTRGAQAVANQTGGSTGQPLHFYQDAEYSEWGSVSRSWGFNLCGFKGGERQVVLWGSDYDCKMHESLKGRLFDRIDNIRRINAFDITDRQLKRVAQELSRRQPDYIWGYASTLELLADQIVKDRLQLRPKGVQTTAGTLYPSLRNKLERVFGKVVYDRYGCREVSLIAHECSEHQGLHEASFHNYVEIIEGDDSRLGKVIVTNLHNKAFPFIRYDIGDLAIWANRKCGCGRSFPLLERVVGRTVEIITSPSGKLMDGEFFTHLFYKVRGVRRFQVVQESRNLLVIKIVKAEDFEADALSFLESKIKEHGDPEFETRFEFVDRIPPLSSGKMAFVLSKVPVELR
jgi:phenylacetate-CoA ligase